MNHWCGLGNTDDSSVRDRGGLSGSACLNSHQTATAPAARTQTATIIAVRRLSTYADLPASRVWSVRFGLIAWIVRSSRLPCGTSALGSGAPGRTASTTIDR